MSITNREDDLVLRLHDNHNHHNKERTFLTFERATIIASILVAVGSLHTTVQSIATRVSTLELKYETLSEMRGDVKVLLERTSQDRNRSDRSGQN